MKTFMIRLMLTLVFLLAFNGLFFLLSGTENPTSVWISYAFVHIAYFTMLFIPIYKTKGEGSYYLVSSLYVQSISYFLIELIIGTLFIIWQLEEPIWPLIIQVILWLIYMVLILGNAWANQTTAKSLKMRQQDINQYQANLMNIKRLLAHSEDTEVKRILVNCYDKLDISTTRQTTASENLDTEIAQMIELLNLNLRSGDNKQSLDSAMNLNRLIEERKNILKYSH